MLAAAALLAGACEPKSGNQAVAAETGPPGRQDQVRYLDSARPSTVLAVDAAAADEDRAFVAVEIGEVDNPGRQPLTFEVSWRPAGGSAEPLGTFSLYPADNPGRFIVATRGKTQRAGEIVLTIEDAKAEGMESVRVGVARLGFAPRRN